ncbi:MAG: hypothetical protein A2161_03625 [Candidatus Schekmanbacteria bacterium RBG_13_48_7]|uniref:GGDEF domain-containing protein n=1 Tax=Candidatus Schekmanbacteria bacterium RBG_13_48_7 TaxID=1817878 RepID=A0A1F7RQS8_9BACT|nr:MAG: hypothetical protein A2161_03625 [Candidatus Schekmanbacteria bacterium RBG_13_48_7]
MKPGYMTDKDKNSQRTFFHRESVNYSGFLEIRIEPENPSCSSKAYCARLELPVIDPQTIITDKIQSIEVSITTDISIFIRRCQLKSTAFNANIEPEPEFCKSVIYQRDSVWWQLAVSDFSRSENITPEVEYFKAELETLEAKINLAVKGCSVRILLGMDPFPISNMRISVDQDIAYKIDQFISDSEQNLQNDEQYLVNSNEKNELFTSSIVNNENLQAHQETIRSLETSSDKRSDTVFNEDEILGQSDEFLKNLTAETILILTTSQAKNSVQSMIDILKNYGYMVQVTSDIWEAFRLCRTIQPGLFIIESFPEEKHNTRIVDFFNKNIDMCMQTSLLFWGDAQLTQKFLYHMYPSNLTMPALFSPNGLLIEVSRRLASMRIMKKFHIQDPITGLGNHTAFQTRLKKIINKNSVQPTLFSITLFDIDYFSLLNDSYGYDASGLILRSVAQFFLKKSSLAGNVYRYGGDAFALVLQGLDLAKAVIFSDQIRDEINTFDIQVSETEQAIINLVVSGGVACFPHDAKNRKELIEKAESRLMAAKTAGRNRIYPENVGIKTNIIQMN